MKFRETIEDISSNKNGIKLPKKTIIGVACAAVLGLTLYSNSYYIQSYERGILTKAGVVQDIMQPGFHVTIPFLESVYRLPISIQKLTTEKLNTYTSDNQEVDAILSVQFQYPPETLKTIFTSFLGGGFSQNSGKLYDTVVNSWKIEAGKINVSDFPVNRGKLVSTVKDKVTDRVKTLYGIEIVDVQLIDVSYQDSYRNAQAQAAVVKTQIEQAEGLKRKSQIDAERNVIEQQGQATALVAKAKGDAEARILNADAEAKSITAIGKASADAAIMMADALSKNPALVGLKQAEKWNGSLPQNIYAGAPIPFINTNK
jgi:regulator of protease activity HflC (stomatin/prohibitin superfamily)